MEETTLAEKGGRACKEGARYEDKCIINQLLDVLYGINYSVTVEPTGKDEIVTDMIVVKADGLKEYMKKVYEKWVKGWVTTCKCRIL